MEKIIQLIITTKQYNMSNTNTNKLHSSNASGMSLDIQGEFYDDILSKCRKNKSNSCRHVLTNDTVYKIYMDEEERLYFKDPKKQGLFTLLERIACLEEIKEYEEGEKKELEEIEQYEEPWEHYRELLEFCINSFRDTENNSISDFRKMKWIKFCEKNEGADILTEALTEYNKRKQLEEDKIAKKCGHKHDKAKDWGNDNCYSCDMKEIFNPPPNGICPETGRKLNEIYDCKYCGIDTNGTDSFLDANDKTIYICGACSENEEEEEEEDVLVHCSNKDPIKHNVKELRQYANKIKEEEEEEEEEEYEYGAYSLEKMFKIVIMVAGGGLGNGNAYANIECEYKTEEEYETGEEGDIYYCEYGSNPVRCHVGTRIVWGEEDKFNVE